MVGTRPHADPIHILLRRPEHIREILDELENTGYHISILGTDV
jgi:hypothetical protein